jgi:hypothetical protein
LCNGINLIQDELSNVRGDYLFHGTSFWMTAICIKGLSKVSNCMT